MDVALKTQKENEERVAEEYLSSLSDLNCNSKPLINMLTMLAEENIEFAAVIVKVVEQHIAKVSPDIKLPILYLIDSIVKNVKSTYVQLFSQCLVNIFCGVFEKVNEKVRERMYALRQTWNEVFPAQKMYALDVKVKRMDVNWPITAKHPMQPSIHVNPNFLKTVNAAQAIPTDMEEIVQAKTRELLELKKLKLELELEATKKHLEEQEKQLSKATESVIPPPVEALVAASGNSTAALATNNPRQQGMPPQLLPGMMPNAGHPHHIVSAHHPTMTGMRPPGMYHQQFRNPRPHMQPVAMINMQQAYSLNNTVAKPKVHPVTPSLLNSVRHRDPRLARQQQQQQQQIQNPTQMSGRVADKSSILNTNQLIEESTRNLESEMKSAANKARNVGPAGAAPASVSFKRKSPTRHSSSSSRGSSSSGRSSSKSSLRDKDRERKRNTAYNSSASGAGGASSSSSEHRRKNGGAAGLNANQKCKVDDKDAFEIAPLSSAFKRKSSSPASSPSKSKDSKRSNKFRSQMHSRTKNRSPSPSAEKVAALASSKDVDLRIIQNKSSPEKRIKLSISVSPIREAEIISMEKERKASAAAAAAAVLAESSKDLDKNIEEALLPMPMLTSKDVDLRQITASSALTSSVVISTETSAKIVTTSTSSPKVSFKIQKPFNILEKSTENFSTVITAKETTVGNALDTIKQELKRESAEDDKAEIEKVPIAAANNDLKPEPTKIEAIDEDTKKRPPAELLEEEVLMPKKKSKQQTKLDTLFGTEDVDLRTVPPQILAVQQSSSGTGIMTPPPPPMISDEQKLQKPKNSDSINNNIKPSLKPEAAPLNANAPVIKKSSLEDVRAKLAKAAKYNKISKAEKHNKELSQRLKLAELSLNDDTLEANDDKIRTIISQAQELHESGSINQEQYKNLVQTVMSLNETTKLNEAKRRESLVVTKPETIPPAPEDAGDETTKAIDVERTMARDAVLKKRIPKLSKDQIKDKDHQSPNTTNETNIEDSPVTVEKSTTSRDDSNIAPTTAKLKQKPQNKEKQQRNKPSKWGERVIDMPTQQQPAGPQQPIVGAPPNASWLPGAGFNKRGPAFSGRVPHPPLPPIPNPNLRMPQMTLPSPWQIGAGVVPPFAANQVPMLRSSVPPPPQPPAVPLPPVIPAPPVIPKPCNSIDNPQADMVRSVTIDGMAKEIRIYDQIAIVFMELDQPREIGFQAGQRSIIIDNMEPLPLKFNDDFRPITIDGELHHIRFGLPSRELYIDDHWYEIYFGGPAVSIPLKNKFHMLKAEGPPPQVNIGALRRDLVLGKINMIVDALIIIPIFLDAKVQSFRLHDKEHTIQFADSFLTVLIDGEITPVEYGALPKRMTLGGTDHFVRFGALPQGVIPGKVLIKDMIYMNTEPPSAPSIEIATPAITAAVSEVKDTAYASGADATKTEIPKIPAAALNNFNIDELFQKLVSSGILGATNKAAPANVTSTDIDADTKIKTDRSPPNAAATDEEDVQILPQEVINPIDLGKPEHIKTRQAAIVSTLFSGMQCSSCGVRFPPEQTIKYSQHLDWHFRQNRRDRDSTRKAHSRKWYYVLADWVQYEEIEDLEEREKNFFESQQNDLEIFDDASNQRSTNSPGASCPAGPDDVNRACDVCQEKFEQFYNEELEEWHMRLAVRVEDKIYHPLCYEDYKASLNPPVVIPDKDDEPQIINDDDDNAMDTIIKIEGDNNEDEDDAKMSVTIPDDDDDDVIVLPNEEPSVTEIVDDDEDEYIPANVTREEMGIIVDDKDNKELNDTAESDVEIQEPNIPFTDLDTYEEKELPEGDETSQISFMNVRIKEEPKDGEEDDDDGFEDVGTVMISPDEEISIQSSEGTPTHTITSSAPSPTCERPPSPTSHDLDGTTSTDCMEVIATDANISMDGTTDLEPEDDNNLSAAGPAPAIPVTSLVNKIKINITKNIISTNSSSSTTTTSTTTTNSLNSNELNSVSNNSATAEISTIPVLCGGTSSSCIDSSATHTDNGAGTSGGGVSAISVIGSNMNVSSISVIGSYGSSSSRYHHTVNSNRQQQSSAQSKTSQAAPAPAPPAAKAIEKEAPVEEVIEYKLKPALEKVVLKKQKKIECGVETSGLCSIM